MHWHCTWALELLDVCPYLSAFAVLFCFARHCTWSLELLDMCPYWALLCSSFLFYFYNSMIGERNLINECLHCKHQEMWIEFQSFVYYICFANLVNKNWLSYCAWLVYVLLWKKKKTHLVKVKFRYSSFSATFYIL